MSQSNANQAVQPNFVNGVNLDVLGGTVAAIEAEPELGVSRFRATNKWVDGNHNRTTVTGFYAAKQDINHKQPFTLLADEPAILAGNDDGANPVEHLLHALASCLTTSIVAHAAVRGIEVEEVESEIEGDIDLNGFLGLNSKTPKGYTDIRVKFSIKADEKDINTLESLAKFSPVYNTLLNGVPVDVSVERK